VAIAAHRLLQKAVCHGFLLLTPPLGLAQADFDRFEPAILSVTINDISISESQLVLLTESTVLAKQSAIRDWRLRLSDSCKATVWEGENFFPLNCVAGVSSRIDMLRGELAISVAPTAFIPFVVKVAQTGNRLPLPISAGAYATYDTVFSFGNGETASQGVFEVGAFGSIGVLSSIFTADFSVGHQKIQSLQTVFTRDFPTDGTSLRLGEGFTPATSSGWGRRFAGLQFGTQFNRFPGIRTMPTPSISGVLPAPGVADIVVNGVFAGQQALPAGPFVLNGIQAPSGASDVRLKVRTVGAGEQFFSDRLYVSTDLLEPQVTEFSVYAGKLAPAGVIHPGQVAVGAHLRRGLSNTLTGALGFEGGREHQSLGGELLLAVPRLGLFKAGAVANHLQDKNLIAAGAIPLSTQIGWEWRSRDANFSLSRRTFRYEDDINQSESRTPPATKLRSAADSIIGFGGALGRVSANVRLLDRRIEDKRSQQFGSGTMSIHLGKSGFLAISGQISRGATRERSWLVNYSVPWDSNRSVGVSIKSQIDSSATDRTESQFYLQKSSLQEVDSSYRVVADSVGNYQADYTISTALARLSLETSRTDNDLSHRIRLSGALITLGSQLEAGRKLDDAFAIVRVGEIPGVRVFIDNRLVGRTNSAGTIFVPRLRPYESNRISIEQSDIPVGVEIATVEQDVVPVFRSGHVIDFPIRSTKGGTLRILLPNGEPVPLDAVVERLSVPGTVLPVAENGRIYLPALMAENRLKVTIAGIVCHVRVSYKASADPQPDLGETVCVLDQQKG
jgi:outer membrane usher protein